MRGWRMWGWEEMEVKVRGVLNLPEWSSPSHCSTSLHPSSHPWFGIVVSVEALSWFGKGSVWAGEEPSAVGNVCLLLGLLPGGGALDEGWLGATWRGFITTSEIFPALLYSRLFVYPRLGGEAGGWRDTINGNVPEVQMSGGVLKKRFASVIPGLPNLSDCISFFLWGKNTIEFDLIYIWFYSL